MKRSHRYRERDYAFGNLCVTFRTTIGVNQAGLARLLGVSERAVQTWEGGLNYPKPEHLKHFIELCVKQHVFTRGREQDEACTFWKLARTKVLFDEHWMSALLAGQDLPSGLTQQMGEGVANIPARETQPGAVSALATRVDWSGAFDVSHFYGRESEITELTRWVVEDHCRLVAVLGMGGIGKSALTITFMHQVAPSFQSVAWRSLRDAPPCEELLADLLQTLSPQPLDELPEGLERRISLLLEQLRTRRCLVVLDNLETLLQEDNQEGRYRQGYEGYGRLVHQVADMAHQSCLVLTSREKPAEVGPLEGPGSPTRSLRLKGLDEAASAHLLAEKGLIGDTETMARLIVAYSGNPLALKIVSETIRELFAGQIGLFLSEGELLFNGVRALLAQQFTRLSRLEQQTLLWLAVVREPIDFSNLFAFQTFQVSRVQLLEALEALRHRSLVERGDPQGSFTLQSVVLEYVTDELVQRVSEEVQQGAPELLCSHALEQAWAKDYLRRTQRRLLLLPILARLQSTFTQEMEIERQLVSLLEKLRKRPASFQGYGPANVMALLRELRGHLRGLDLSRLVIRGAYLQGVEMQESSLREAELRYSAFTDAFSLVTAISVSKNDAYRAVGISNGEVRVWRVRERMPHLVLLAHTTVVGLAFSPDGQTLASAGREGLVKVWEVQSGALIWTLRGHHDSVQQVDFAPDGRTLASCSTDGTLRLWDLGSGSCVQVLDPQRSSSMFSVVWHPGGRLLASGSSDGLIRVWDSQQGTCIQSFSGHTNWVVSLAFSPDGTTLASASLDGMVKLWEVESGNCVQTLSGHTAYVNSVAFSPDGRTLASGGGDATIRLWDVEHGVARTALLGHQAGVYALAFTRDGTTLLSGGEDRTVREWDITSGQCVRIIEGYASKIYNVAYSSNGSRLASSSLDATVTLWDAVEGKPIKSLKGHTQLVYFVAWSPDGQWLASGSSDRTVRIWDAITGTCTHVFRGHTGLVRCVAWSSDGRLVASLDNHRFIGVWDVREASCRWMATADPEGGARRLAWSPDGQLLACEGRDLTVLLLYAEDGSVFQRLQGHQVTVDALAWSPDGKRLLSGGGTVEEGELLLWDVQRGKCLRRFPGHQERIQAVAWSPGGDQVISGGSDRTIRLWDVESGACLKSYAGVPISSISVRPDGGAVASCDDEMITLWDLPRLEPLRTLRTDRPYERLDITGVKGISAAQRTALLALGAIEDATVPSPFVS